MRIHIALIGGQTIPIYQGIQKAKPEEVYLIHSPQTENQAKIIKLECKKLNIATKLESIEAVDLEQAKKKARELLALPQINNPVNVVTLNLTGGPKIWTIAFYETFKDASHVEIFYTEQGANTILLNTTQENSSLLPNIEPMSLDTIFRLNGNPNCQLPAPFSPNDEDYLTCQSLLRLYRMNSEKLRIMTNINDIAARLGLKCKKEVMEKTVYQAIKQYGDAFNKCQVRYSDNPEQLHLVFDKTKCVLRSPECFKLFFNFRWFEYLVAMTISKWPKCQVLYRNVSYGKEKEFDVIAHVQSSYASKALFIECKTALDKPTVIREFAQAVRDFGGSGSIALLITYWPINTDVLMSCLKSNVIPFSLVGDFGKSIGALADSDSSLFKMLEGVIGTNRAK